MKKIKLITAIIVAFVGLAIVLILHRIKFTRRLMERALGL